MKKITLIFILLASSFFGYSQFPNPYCGETYGFGVEPISLVSLQSINNASSATAGGTAHEDFTATGIPASLIIGNSYLIIVKGNTVGNFTDYIRVFIDWNNDGDFLDPNESYDIGTITNSTGLDGIQASNFITVPAGTSPGPKRMRVTKKYAGYQAPCNTTGYGQAEDYTILAYSTTPYCTESYPSNVEPITQVSLFSISHSSSATVNGTAETEDFTATVPPAYVVAGRPYTIIVKGNTVGNFTDYIRVFVDWNNDGDFLDPGESFDIGTITNSTGLDAVQVSGLITPPAGTSPGNKRMRVTKKYAGYQSPCNTGGYGQAEDYLLTVYSMAPYCTATYTLNVEPITLVSFFYTSVSSGAAVNGSPENEDFTGFPPTRIVPGRSYSITVKGNTDGNFTDYIRVFVDWNNDGDFLDAGESTDIGTITNSTGLDGVQVTGSITVPPGTTVGNKRMRVSKLFNAYPLPCNTGGYGQSEDYTVLVYQMSPYCTDSYPSNIEPITKVDFSAISNWTGATVNGSPDNEDFTFMNGIVVPGNTYTMKVQGNTDGNYTDYISVFIDWNENGDFLDPNEVYNIGTITNSTGLDAVVATAPIAVPAGTSFGNKRMRVVKHYGSYESPCAASGFGQSEDYTLTVVGSIKAVLTTGNAYLQGDYVEVGINQCGGWGTTTTAPEGYHARSGTVASTVYNAQLSLGFVADPDKDGWAAGSPNKYNGDYFMPVAPYIGWGINFNGTNYGTDRTNSTRTGCALMPGSGTPFQTFSGSNISATAMATKAESVWEGTHNGLKVQKITTVKQDKVYFTARIKLVNTTAFPITNIYYGEYINPDPEAYYFDLYTGNLNSINTIVNQNPANGQALVQAISAPNNIYVALGTKDCRAKVFRGTGTTTPNFSPINWYAGTGGVSLTGADPAANNLFYGIAYNIGTLAPGDSTSFLYTYILKATDFDEALSETEPSFLTGTGTSFPNDGTITPCANSSIDVSIVDGDYYSWVWSPAAGLNTTTGKNVTITAGTTPVTYTITGTGTCANKTITLNVAPINSTEVTITPGSINKCISDLPVLLTADGGNFTDAVILNEKFNTAYNTWTAINNSTAGTPANAAWTLRPDGYIYSATTFHSNDNSQFYLSNSDAQGAGSITATILQSPAFSTVNYSSVNLGFYHYFREDAPASTAAVEVSTDAVNWTNLQTFTATTGSSSAFNQETIALPGAFLNQPVVYIRFKYDGSWRWYWAIDNIQVSGNGQPITWSPVTGLFTDAAGTIPYAGTVNTNVYANPAVTTTYTATSQNGQCTKAATVDVTVNSLTNNLAGVVGAATCQSKAVDIAGTVYNATSCDLIGKLTPAGSTPVSGDVNMCVTLDDMTGPLPVFNAEPYLTRHFDIEPSLAAATVTGRVTLYFSQAEFDNYNAKNGVWPDLPTGPADAAGIANLRVTQYHGTPTTTPSSPAAYTGSAVYINPNDVDITWNGNFWEVSFDVTGFSGFYVHTNLRFILPVSIIYFNGSSNGNDNILNWKVNCNNTAGFNYTLERSTDGIHFTAINAVNPALTACSQPFSYTDLNAPKGINYYMLKVTGPDGSVTYSNKVVLANNYKGADIFTIAPDPVPSGGEFALTIVTERQGKTDIIVRDMQGRMVYRKTVPLVKGANVFDMNIAGLAAGSYQLSGYRDDMTVRTIRFVKL